MHSGYAKKYLGHLDETTQSAEARAELHRALGECLLESPKRDSIIMLLWTTHSVELSRALESRGNFAAWQEENPDA